MNPGKTLWSILLWLAALVAPMPALAVEASGRDFEALILERINAFAAGDADRYLALLAEDFVHISDSGVRRTHADMEGFVRSNPNIGRPITYRVDALHWQQMGDYAITDCVMVEQTPAGPGQFRESNLFRRVDGRWLFVHHQETPIVQAPKAIAIDPARLADYVGRYDYGGGLLDIVTLVDGALYVGDGTAPARLIPVAPDAFAVSGAAGLLMFFRDDSGAVAGEVFVAINGEVASSRKLPAEPAVE